MRCRLKQAKVGDVLPVNDSDFHYQLPPGLKAGTLVKLLAFDAGFWTVEADGQQFSVFLTRIESGWEYELNGRWLPADDLRVIATRAESTLRDSPAYSVVDGACVNPPLPV
jgi:hypothetical protein